MRSVVFALALSPVLLLNAADDHADVSKRLQAATDVFNEIMSTPEKGIPREILEHAQCVGIVPGLKRAGFIVGAKYGKGFLVCRTASERWSAPEAIRIEGGSFGLQIGAGETDLVFVVKNHSGEEKLMQDKFTVGGDAAAMGGPVGRDASAQTDAQMHAEILSYSRARGVFAGISLDGSTLRPDKDDNHVLYGENGTPRQILNGDVRPPADAQPLYAMLNRYAEAAGGHNARK